MKNIADTVTQKKGGSGQSLRGWKRIAGRLRGLRGSRKPYPSSFEAQKSHKREKQ